MGKGLLGIIILALITLFMALVWPFNASKRSAAMGETIQSALNENGYNFATVTMSGNVARLSGTAPSASAKTGAESLAASTKCEACENKDTWHEVASDLDVKQMAMAKPYTFSAVKADDGMVTLDGYVRSEAERERVLREANTLFDGQYKDSTIKVASGAPNAGWGDAVSMNLAELRLLDKGRFSMEDTQTLITGLANTPELRDKINTMVGALPEGYNGAANITVPDTAALNVGEVKSEGICQTLFTELKGDNKVLFNTDKASINGASSFDLLITLASAANQCASFRISVDGHTDNVGDETYNQALSEARANTVVAYLADNGVELSRLTAQGFGETSPIASNETDTGRAQNRRIEFVVTRAN